MGTYPFNPGGGGGGSVDSVTAGDASIVIGGTAANPTVETGTLDEIAALHAPVASVALNSQKITSLANGSASSDAAAYGQTPAGGTTVTIAEGGTGQTGRQAAINALAGAVTASEVLAGNGTNITLRALTTADLPAGTVTDLTPSGDATGVTDAASITAAVSALPASGGVVRLAATGIWYVECGQVSINKSGVYIDARGCFINAVGAGDMIRMYDSSNITSRAVQGGGILGNPVIDGTNTTGAASALHLGDIFRATAYLSPQNFTQTGSDGAIFDNTYWWTERLDAEVHATSCYRHVRFTQNPAVPGTPTATGSFMRGDLKIYVDQSNASYDGIVFENGTYATGAFTRWWGNFTSTGSGGTLSSAAVKVTGATPAGSADSPTPSNLYEMLVDWNFECAPGTFTPYAVWLDAVSGCSAASLLGTINFAPGGSLNFNGYVGSIGLFGISDTIPFQTAQTMLFEGITAVGSYATAAPLATNGDIATSTTWAHVGPASTVTGVTMDGGTQDGQIAAVFNDSAFGITFAAAGTSNVATGTAEFIPPGAMRIYLWSVYGLLWYPVSGPWYANGSGQAATAAPVLLAAGTSSAAPLNFTSGTNLSAAAAGAHEYDGVAAYFTNETTSGRGLVPVEQRFRLTSTGGTISTIANYFGSTSNISLVSGAEYEIEIVCWFLKSTAGTVTWTFTNSAAPTSMTLDYELSPATGIVTTAAASDLFGQQYNITATAPTVVSASLTSAVNHRHKFWIRLINGTGTSLKIQATASAGTITPGINSYWKARRVPAANVGSFSA